MGKHGAIGGDASREIQEGGQYPVVPVPADARRQQLEQDAHKSQPQIDGRMDADDGGDEEEKGDGIYGRPAPTAGGGHLLEPEQPDTGPPPEMCIRDSINIPLSQLELAEKQISDKDRKLFVYCRTGARSAQACAMLMKMGFSDPINIGGIEEVNEKDEILES